MKTYLILFAFAAVVVTFQNCTNQQFSPRTDVNKAIDGSEELVLGDTPIIDDEAIETDDEDETVVKEEPKKETYPSKDDDDDDVVKEEPKKETYPSKDDDDDHVVKEEPKKETHPSKDDDDDRVVREEPKKETHSSKDDDDDHVVKNENPKEEESGSSCHKHDDGNGRYLCVLEGKGKSQHIALIDGAIVSSNSTPKSVCMSKNACEVIVGKKMNVQSSEQRGFCKNGAAHSLVLTDKEVQTLVDKLQ